MVIEEFVQEYTGLHKNLYRLIQKCVQPEPEVYTG
jgi:hypothetical protein